MYFWVTSFNIEIQSLFITSSSILYNNDSLYYESHSKLIDYALNNPIGTPIDEDKFMYEGKECIDYDVKVVLEGVNKKTGEPIHLISSQTGL